MYYSIELKLNKPPHSGGAGCQQQLSCPQFLLEFLTSLLFMMNYNYKLK